MRNLFPLLLLGLAACGHEADPATQAARYEAKAEAAARECARWNAPSACDDARDAQAVADYYRSRV